MVFLPSRLPAHADARPDDADGAISPVAATIIDLLDVVGAVRDVEHLQAVAFLAQEFGLLAAPALTFGSRGPEPRRPHSALLEGHFYALLCEKVIDRDGAGRLRPRRDLYRVPHAGLAGRRLGALAALSPRDTMVFAAAVLRLAREGRHAASVRHDAAFYDAAATLAALCEDGHAVDVAAICAARGRLMPAAPVLLGHQLSVV